MSENRGREQFLVSHYADEFAFIICRALCFSKVRFSLAFYRRNLVFSPWNLAWNSLYTVENPNLSVCRLNSPPIGQSFSSVLRPEVSL